MNSFGRWVLFTGLSFVVFAAAYDHGMRLEMWQALLWGVATTLAALLSGSEAR